MLFHDEEEVSLGLRRLALSPYYRKYFDFYQMKNPPKDRLRQLGLKKLSKLVMFMADPVLLAEPDSMPPIDNVSFEMGFIFDNLKMFLDDMIAEHGKYLQDVRQISTEADLGPLLLDTGKRYFLLFIIDKEREITNDQLVDRMNDLLILNKGGGDQVASAYVDYRCYPYLGEVFRFQEKDVPLMVVYDSKESTYLRSDSKLNIYDGRDLIDKAVQSDQYRSRFRKVKFQLGPNKCLVSEEKIDL